MDVVVSDEVRAVLVIAGTELAIFGSTTWSRLLSDEDLELLEYASDIKVITKLLLSSRYLLFTKFFNVLKLMALNIGLLRTLCWKLHKIQAPPGPSFRLPYGYREVLSK